MTSFAVTWDYRCPFARNAHEHLLDGLADGADWDVTFVPFSLGQVHVEEGETPIWDRPDEDTGLLALQAGTVVRDTAPEAFPTCTTTCSPPATTTASTCGTRTSSREVLTRHGVDADAVFAAIDDGGALDTVRKEHEAAARRPHRVGRAHLHPRRRGGVRPADGPPGRPTAPTPGAPSTGCVDLLGGFPELNEFKHTSIKR